MHGNRLKQTFYRARSTAEDWLPMLAGIIPARHVNNGKPRNTT
jgi:hypothetical protein